MKIIKYTTQNLQKRLLCVLTIVALVFLFVIGKLMYVQLIQGTMLQSRAISQWTRDLPLSGLRGSIVDTNGDTFASSFTSYNIYLRASNIVDAETVANLLAEILGIDYQSILQKATDKSVSERLLAQQVSGELVERILASDLDGVYIAETSTRQYPYGDLLTSVLGYTTIDNIGQSGIEAYYDNYLQGTDGYAMTESTITGVELSNSTTTFVSGIQGCTVQLTIDVGIQQILEGVLDRAMEEQQAKGATGIIMDATNGEILAMATKPSFDLNNIPRDDIETLLNYSKNTTVVDIYEPGSTFKIFTTAAALSSGVTNIDDTFYDPGYRIISGERIKCWRTQGHGHETLLEGFCNSCNSVFMDLGLRMGTEVFYQYLQKFGIGQKTGIDFYGESAGIVMDASMVRDVDLARIAFGQAIAVTPLQMLNSVCGIVNGTRYQPRLIKSITSANGTTKEFGSVIVGSTVSNSVRDTINQMLEAVVSTTGECTFVAGYHVGGKTGTAQKYEDGRVATGKYVSSFIGTYPASAPKYVMLICVDEPSAGIYYGSQVAKPYGGMIFKQMFDYLSIAPDVEMAEITADIEVPNLVGLSITQAGALLRSIKLDYVIIGEGEVVLTQAVPAGTKVFAETIIQLFTE